ncbi:DNA alkylation repair protein [Bacillus spongiae]|uniref:DNA alkylation repair protein n=1 Tax=Bacillus spongiae TaxID=2683610 RepID=A0ABU8HDE9_9BACI
MSTPYRCPNCKTNKTRFNMIEQISHAVKINPESGEIVESFNDHDAGPFHLPYNGPEYRIQCAACGLIEDEKTFAKFGESHY